MHGLLRSLGGLALLAGALPAADFEDDTHPRAPGTPLEIRYRPYYCATCVEEERIAPPETPRTIEMMRLPVEELAKHIGLGGEWYAIETGNFKILSSLQKTKVKFKDMRYARADLERLKEIFPALAIGRETAYVDAHQRAHLYHIRAERIYAHFAALTDTKTKWLGMLERYHLFLFDEYTPHHKLNDMFTGRVNDKAGVQHHIREKPNFMMFTTSEQQVARDKGRGDALFSNHVIHNVAHNLIDGHGNYYRETWGWVEEGLGHYYERRENERYNTFCWSEGKPPRTFMKPDWRSVIYGLVRRGKDPPLSQWCEKLQPGQLTGVENGISWSIVEWLVTKEPIRFTKMVSMVDDTKAKPSSEQAIEAAFGVSPSVLHQRWREYVLDEYRD